MDMLAGRASGTSHGAAVNTAPRPSTSAASACVPRAARLETAGTTAPGLGAGFRGPLARPRTYRTQQLSSRRWMVQPAGAAAGSGIEDLVLVGDIGGTNARIMLWRSNPSMPARLTFEKTYPTADYEPDAVHGFEHVLEAALSEAGQGVPDAACIAIAGPVSGNTGQMTNLRWRIDGEKIEKNLGIKTQIINDFEAVGYGIPALPADDLIVLHDAPVDPTGPCAVIGPGTGLGQAQMMWDTGSQCYKVWPSEGSHSDFAPRGWKQRALLSFAEAELNGHCEVEQVACGSGLERIYRFLCSDLDSHMPDHAFCGCKSSTEISKAAADGSDPRAVEALDIFLSIIGQEAGHMALRCMASGGVYIAGGIVPKNEHRLQSLGLVDGYLNRASRFHSVISNYRLTMVKNEQVGLIGARECAFRLAHGEDYDSQ